MVLINAARGNHAHPDRAGVVALIGADDLDTLIDAYTADFAARSDVAAAYPFGNPVDYLAAPVQEALLHPRDVPAADGPGHSNIAATSHVWATVMQLATCRLHGH